MVINYILVGSYKKLQPILLSYFGEIAFFGFFTNFGPLGVLFYSLLGVFMHFGINEHHWGVPVSSIICVEDPFKAQ